MRAIGFAPAPPAPAPPPPPAPPDFKVFAAMMKASEAMTLAFHAAKNGGDNPASAAKFIDGFGYAN